MKATPLMPALALACALGSLRADRFVVDGAMVAASTGTSSNAVFRVAGAVSSTAGGPPSGGPSYSLAGGTWMWVQLLPSEGVPPLSARFVDGGIEVSWTGPATLQLWEAPELSPGTPWWPTRLPVTTSNQTHRITVLIPSGNRFFRLAP